MKLKTSLKNAATIADRIMAVSGIIETPEGQFSCVRIKRAWLFGSTARMKPDPNDTDIILDLKVTGNLQRTNSGQWRKGEFRNNAKTCKHQKKRYGIVVAMDSKDIAYKYLYSNMKMIRLHQWEIDGKYATDRIMLYPKNELKKFVHDTLR